MTFSPLPQQRILIDHILKHPSAACFAGMGLGKTASTLTAIAELLTDGAIKGAVIVAPKRVVTMTWPAELEKWDNLAWMRMVNLRTPEGMAAWDAGDADIYLINYDMLPQFVARCLADRKEIPADMIVWDESSKVKDPAGKRVKAFLPYRGMFRRHVALTGTPAPNNYADLWGQFRLIDGGARLGKSFFKFRAVHFWSDYACFKWTIHPWAKAAIEQKIADITCTLRSEDWLDIPPTSVEDVEVILPPEAARHYRTMEKQFIAEIKGKQVEAVNAAVVLNKLLQITSGNLYDEERTVLTIHGEKVAAVVDLVNRLKKPCLVATMFIHERDCLLWHKGFELFSEDRLDAWNQGEIKAWVADPRSIGHGLNLQEGSDTVIWMTPTWSRELYDQFNARLIRTGQANPTTVYRVICPGTVDDAVAEALRTKGDQQSGLMQALKNLVRAKSP